MRRDWAPAVRRTLIGSSHVTPAALVVTPIRSIFSLFKERGWALTGEDGWWPVLERGSAVTVLVPQGGALADLCAVCGEASSVDLLGYAGALRPACDVGTVVRPSTASIHGDGRALPLSGSSGDGPQVVSVAGLLTAYAHANDLLSAGDVVDMECGHAAAALREVGGPRLRAQLIITDRWPDQPFYAASQTLLSMVAAARPKLVDAVIGRLSTEGFL